MPRRIAGSAGTDPVVGTQPPQQPPAAAEERTGTLVQDGGKLYVQSGGLKIRLDDASANKLQRAPAQGQPSRPRSLKATPPELEAALEAAEKHRAMLMNLPGVMNVRAGYKFIKGEITQIPSVVVAVDRKLRDVPRDQMVPPSLDGVPTDVTIADPYERLAVTGGVEAAVLATRPRLLIDQLQGEEVATLEEALPMITYEPPAGASLDAVTGAMTITCHVSPDAGWRVLEPFLKGTERSIVLGMYDFTAPHIYKAVRSVLLDSDVTWKHVLGPKESLPKEDDVDSTKAGDYTEEKVNRGLKRAASSRFEAAFARTGAGETFASAYHIKVAVRDHKAFWLSSGNWQSSNQPNIDFFAADADRKQIVRYNREWHVVVENPALAKTFERFLNHDFVTASTEPEEEAALMMPELAVPLDEIEQEERGAVDIEVFAPKRFVFTAQNPVTVQPILTPDNYLEVVQELLRRKPRHRLYFQNQSLNPVLDPSPEFEDMMGKLADYSNDPDLDVRMIFRNIGPVRKKLESLQAAGFNMKRVRMQAGCHTKGIIVDSKTILLGSHNFTNQGVQVNRDASLLIENQEEIAKYYERIFLHDWEKLSKPTIREESMPIPLLGNEAAELAPLNIARMSWSAYDGD